MCIDIYIDPGVSWPGLCGCKVTLEEEGWTSEFRSCAAKVEVAVLGSPSLIVHAVSVDVKQH